MRKEIQWIASLHTRPEEVLPFLASIQASADTEKDALGFLPDSVYRDAAEQRKLIVATVQQGSALTYAGHLLFGGVFPHARIFQVYVRPEYRAAGLGRRLLDLLIERVEAACFLTTSARVAADLPANSFWEQMGFETLRVEPGRGKRSRRINIRVRHLNSPRLFAETPAGPTDLQLVELSPHRAPLYVIDLNVFFDVVQGRPRAADAGQILAASFDNRVRLAVADEFVKELERAAPGASADPILAFARQLPQLSPPPATETITLAAQLGELIFPTMARENRLKPRDLSDVRHIATALHHSAAGFTTSEHAILRAREALQLKYGIDVVGVSEFAEVASAPTVFAPVNVTADVHGTDICVREARPEDHPHLLRFLESHGIPRHAGQEIMRATGRSQNRRRLLIAQRGGKLMAVSSWDLAIGLASQAEAVLAADEAVPDVDVAVDHMLELLSREATCTGPALLRLSPLSGQEGVRTVAFAHGFRNALPTAGGVGALQKLAIGRPVHAGNWTGIRQQIHTASSLGLPAAIPPFSSIYDRMSVDTPAQRRVLISIKDLETLLSPVAFILPNRPATIVPIQKRYADELLSRSVQLPLLGGGQVSLARERAYFCASTSARMIAEGGLMLFYESGFGRGSSSVIALARVVRTAVLLKTEAVESLCPRGVLLPETIARIGKGEKVTATVFDNLLHFATPVCFSRLRQLRFVPPTNFVTATKIAPSQLQSIIGEGFPDA